MTHRLRFAPSPTGNLHIGGARTALFNWLQARHAGGKFLLRIEDTDIARSTEESRQAILEALDWLGLDIDEDIVLQSTRRDVHVAAALRLLEEGKAYRCYCTPEELQAMREKATAEGRSPKYDGTWRNRTDHPPEGTPFTVRFAMPLDGTTVIDDIVLGEITVPNEELDDLIILRSDGTPTYNFVVVCDDAFMGVTTVCRGQDHMSNTFRQFHIYRALGHEVPRFAHLPLVDGLSKRKGSASVQHYRDIGYLREAVINYISRLGWSHGDQEIFSVEELVEKFDLADVNRSSGKYDEVKMAWVNEQWIKRLPAEELAVRLLPYLSDLGVETSADERLVSLVRQLQERSKTLVDMAEGARFAFQRPTAFDEKAVKKWIKPASRAAFEEILAALPGLDAFTPDELEAAIKSVAERHELGLGKVAQPIRIALTGTSVSPPIFDAIAIVGREETVHRMRAALHLYDDA
ncbi:MAG: glutamate--tRNA ligase [Deltaproteobacteria bacterium]|nr:MAG: glutamate--tRNA ligase [Deltaproteobacteria bacterium]